MSEATAPIGPKTVTVNGSHWPASWNWDGLHFERADLRSESIWGNDDYHLGVPWMHPDDYPMMHDLPDCWATYRIRLKRGWRSFVWLGDEWMVSKAPRQEGQFGASPDEQVTVAEIAVASRGS